MTARWPRDEFKTAVCAAGSKLTPTERLVALCYADHARDAEFAFVTTPRLMDWTGLARSTARKAVDKLQAAGWLELKEVHSQHRATRYWLRIPTPQGAEGEPSQGADPRPAETSGSPQRAEGEPPEITRGPTVDTRGPTVDTRGPTVGPDQSLQKKDSSIDAREAQPRSAPPAGPTDDESPLISTAPAGASAEVDHQAVEPSAAVEGLSAPERTVVAELLARHGTAITETEAAECVRRIQTGKQIKNLGGYASRFTADQVAAHASAHRSAQRVTARGPARCRHGIAGGMRITGAAANASRVCWECDVQMPATEAEALLAQMPAQQQRRGDIDWDAALARAEARDAAAASLNLPQPRPDSLTIAGEVIAS